MPFLGEGSTTEIVPSLRAAFNIGGMDLSMARQTVACQGLVAPAITRDLPESSVVSRRHRGRTQKVKIESSRIDGIGDIAIAMVVKRKKLPSVSPSVNFPVWNKRQPSSPMDEGSSIERLHLFNHFVVLQDMKDVEIMNPRRDNISFVFELDK